MLTLGSLFAGIGGFELGLERTGGFRTVWQVEIDPYCQKVLARHWPDAQRFSDVREVDALNLPTVDVICGGFPCQDISNAGKRAGISGERSGLWREFARIVRELRPRYVLVENVAALRVRGLGVVLGDLADCGYDAEWSMLSAQAVGAPHLRERVWIIAHADSVKWGQQQQLGGGAPQRSRDEAKGSGEGLAHASQPRREALRSDSMGATDGACRDEGQSTGPRRSLPDSECRRLEGRGIRSAPSSTEFPAPNCDASVAIADCNGRRSWGAERTGFLRSSASDRASWWRVEPDVGRVAHGVPARVDRLRALGNAVVPQCAEVIGRRVLEIDLSLSELVERATRERQEEER